MKPLLGLNGATTGRIDLQQDLRVAAAAGYAAVELREAKLEAFLHAGGSPADVRAMCHDSGLAVASLNALELSTLAVGEPRSAVLERCRQLCGWAAELESPFVVVVPGFLSGQDPTVVREQTIDALQHIAVIARQQGVRVGFEFLGFPDCSVQTLGDARAVAAAASDSAIGLVIDAFHFFTGGSTWAMLADFDPAELFIIHLDDAEDLPPDQLTDAHRLLPGDGVLPLREFVHRVQALGYQGVYSLELFRPEYWERDPYELARVGLEKMERLFSDS